VRQRAFGYAHNPDGSCEQQREDDQVNRRGRMEQREVDRDTEQGTEGARCVRDAPDAEAGRQKNGNLFRRIRLISMRLQAGPLVFASRA
jgi:hypothetical protein